MLMLKFIRILGVACLIGTCSAFGGTQVPHDVQVCMQAEALMEKAIASANALPKDLSEKLTGILNDLKLTGYAERIGPDKEWRAAFVLLQGWIEQSIADGLNNGTLQLAEAAIVAPKMPSPLYQDSSKAFEAIDFNNPADLPAFRLGTLTAYLNNGGVLHATYCQEAVSWLNKNPHAAEIYGKRLKTFAGNLKDEPILTMPMKDFPPEKTGAIYRLNNADNALIALSSYQLGQEGSANRWALAIGEKAVARLNEVQDFTEPYHKQEI